jgi:putative flippase GtrA
MRSFIEFGLLSGGGWLLDVALLLWLSNSLGVHLSVANIISSCVAALAVFTVSRLLIFRGSSERPLTRTVLYAVYTLCVIAIASVLLEPIAWMSQGVAQQFALALSAGQIAFVAKVLVTPPQLLANFCMSRYLAHRPI